MVGGFGESPHGGLPTRWVIFADGPDAGRFEDESRFERFYGDKLITSVLLDKIRKADGKYGAKQAQGIRWRRIIFSRHHSEQSVRRVKADILPDVKITAEEWRHHEHVAGTAVEAAITCVADLSNETLRRAEKDIAIDAVANLILEEGLKYCDERRETS